MSDGSKVNPNVVHSNPFNGKCIHGVAGAIIVAGVLTNPACEHCSGQGNVGK